MAPEPDACCPPGLSLGVFEGRQAFAAAIGQALAWALAQDCRDLRCMDASFVDWPLSEPALLADLQAWAKPGRRLLLLARQYEDLRRRHPRFVQWRGRYGHCVQARAFDEDWQPLGQGAPEALLWAKGRSATLSLRLLDKLHWRGVLSLSPLDAVSLREQIDASLQRSYESFASTTLGL
ncbi:hypothetical protein HNP55_002460 [Paucibacter oligotrophus]|uniref:Uncharacterized protein n=1 Tax=Roseateles oligotrophus TaxID=1769250 RepID=A0A840LF57_9BURK|nr:hypothetical protein [Roseateles oligotrophus]MBB4843937.1 hypothetical protein [Roseateles oligotrophus]